MYNPAPFRQHHPETLRGLMRDYPLATLVVMTESGLDAAHLPLLWQDDGSEHGMLVGHFARANPIYQTALPDAEWLAIFHGAAHYISPNHYPDKAIHHKVVPTYNYQAVHARGRLNLFDDEARLLSLLHEQTVQFEGETGWQLADAPVDFAAMQCRGIVGFELSIRVLEGKFKLSQNQSPENRLGVINGLRALSTPEAERMADLVAEFQDKRDAHK